MLLVLRKGKGAGRGRAERGGFALVQQCCSACRKIEALDVYRFYPSFPEHCADLT